MHVLQVLCLFGALLYSDVRLVLAWITWAPPALKAGQKLLQVIFLRICLLTRLLHCFYQFWSALEELFNVKCNEGLAVISGGYLWLLRKGLMAAGKQAGGAAEWLAGCGWCGVAGLHVGVVAHPLGSAEPAGLGSSRSSRAGLGILEGALGAGRAVSG